MRDSKIPDLAALQHTQKSYIAFAIALLPRSHVSFEIPHIECILKACTQQVPQLDSPMHTRINLANIVGALPGCFGNLKNIFRKYLL